MNYYFFTSVKVFLIQPRGLYLTFSGEHGQPGLPGFRGPVGPNSTDDIPGTKGDPGYFGAKGFQGKECLILIRQPYKCFPKLQYIVKGNFHSDYKASMFFMSLLQALLGPQDMQVRTVYLEERVSWDQLAFLVSVGKKASMEIKVYLD